MRSFPRRSETTGAPTSKSDEAEGEALERLKRLLGESHRPTLWQALAVYLGASFAALEAVDLLIERVGLPAALFPLAFALLAIGLPIVLLTAFVQSTDGARPHAQPSEALTPEDEISAGALGLTRRMRRLLTWRNVIGSGVVAFTAWGVVATAWLLVGGGPALVSDVSADNTPSMAPTSVAVLYFDDFSQNGELRYLADGLTEALIHELTQVGALRVISRNGVKPYRDPDVPIDSVARALNVGSLVEGSVEKLGDRLRVTVQLIDGTDGTHLLSRRVERSGDDLLELRDGVVQEAARLLRQRLGEEIELREGRAGTSSDEAWAHVQRAEQLRKDSRDLWSAGDSASSIRKLREADSLLEVAEELDSDWPEPTILRGWLAADLAVRQGPEYAEYDETTARTAVAHAERALRRWPNHPHALALRGHVRARLWEQSSDPTASDTLRAAAERDFRLALEQEPGLARAWASLGRLLRKTGEFAAAKLAAERAYQMDAYLEESPLVLFNLCHISIELKEFEEAARWCGEGERRFPEAGFFIEPQLLLLASAIGPEPDVEKAWKLYARMLESYAPLHREKLRPIYMLYVAAVLARAGLTDSARAVIDRARSGHRPSDLAVDYYEANARLRLGEPQTALRLLAGYADANPGRREYLASDWWWEELRDEPGFEEIVTPRRNPD